MADLAALAALPKIELVELIGLLSFRLGGLSDETIAEARFHAATKRAEMASAAVDEAAKAHVDALELHAAATARGLTPSLDLAGLSRAYRQALAREKEAYARLGAIRMGVDR